MSQVIIKNIIIIAGLAIACSGHAAQEAEPVIFQASQAKISPRLAHARHAQQIRIKRYDARKTQLEALEESGRDHSRLSGQIMDSIHSWSLDKGSNSAQLLAEASPNSTYLQVDPAQASRKISLHEELLASFKIEQALAPEAQDFADLGSAE